MKEVKLKSSEPWLVFVDTNILLDFYRLRGSSALRQLKVLERHKDLIITSDQVRMEYLKHRQRVILDTLSEIKKPINQKLPPIFADYTPAKMMKKHIEDSEKKHKEVMLKAQNVIIDPSHHDDVFKHLSRIFETNTSRNLNRSKKVRFEIRNLARKRFVLGYPPRKSADTSIGDALNWEWIVRCAQDCSNNSHILIVSRDGDYGSTIGEDSVLNDWLKREFKERVSRKRKIELTTKLTVAMRRLDEIVTIEDEKEETILLQGSRALTFERFWRYRNRGAAARLLAPDPEIEMFLENDLEIDDAIPEYDESVDMPDFDSLTSSSKLD